MSIISGPKVSDEGLVLHYDMSNTEKSFKGRPTSNLAYVNGYTTQASAVSSVPDEQNLRKLSGAPVTDRVAILNNTASNFLDFYRVDGIVLDPGDAVVVSYYVYPLSTPNQFNANGNFGTELGTNAGLGGVTNLPPNQWSRIVVSKTNTTASQITVNTLRVEPYTPAQWGGETNCYAANPQFEVVPSGQTVFASPFVSGTRASTESIKDLTTDHTFTTTSLTFNSDNTFSFNGTSDYIDLPNDLGYTTQVSAFAWFRSQGTPAGSYHIVCGGTHLEISVNTGDFLRTGVETSNGRFVSNHGSGLLDGDWHYIGFTFDGSTKTAYIDGEAVGTLPVTGTLINSFSSRRIGRFGSSTTYYMNGDIAVYSVYNRPLTANEVRDNFEAVRSRFGI